MAFYHPNHMSLQQIQFYREFQAKYYRSQEPHMTRPPLPQQSQSIPSPCKPRYLVPLPKLSVPDKSNITPKTKCPNVNNLSPLEHKSKFSIINTEDMYENKYNIPPEIKEIWDRPLLP